LVGVLAVAMIVAVVLTIFAFNQQGIALENAQQAEQNAATAQSESYARATQQAIAEEQAEARAVAEEQALEDRDRSIVAEQDALVQREEALHQAAIGLASQAELQANGRAPETSVLLALEALENYPLTWQAEKALGNSILKSRLRAVIPYDDYLQVVEWSSDGSQILISGMELISESPWKWENANVRLLDASTGEKLLKITEGEPNMASWSPDEKLILALNEGDVILKVWDAESGVVRFTLDIEDIGGDLNTNITDWEPWSPGGDRFLLYTKDGLVKIFDGLTGEPLQSLTGHQGELLENQDPMLSQAMWSPGGDLVAVSSRVESNVIVYQVDTGKALYTIPGDFEDSRVVLGGWSPSGDRFVTRGLGGAKVYEAATGQLLLDLIIPQTYFRRAVWSPDGSYILTQDGFESATVWDAENGQVLSSIEDIVQAMWVEWSPSGDFAAVAGADGFVHVWDVITGQVVHKLSGTMGWANRLEFSTEGESILAVGDDNTINILDLTEASLMISVSTCYFITNPAWSPDGQQVAFGSNCPPDYPIKIWDANSGELQFELISNLMDAVDVNWSPSGDRILTSYGDGHTMIWDASNGELLLPYRELEDGVRVSEWSPDGSQIATGYTNGTVVVWDSSNGEEIITFVGHTGGWICSARWSPDGSRLMSTNDQGEAIIWDAATGKVLLELFSEEFKNAVPDAAWTKDGNQVILFSEDGYVRIFDPNTGDELDQFFTRSGSMITFFSLSPSEERMIIGGNDNLATVWDIASGTEILAYEVGGFVYPAYSPDGSQVLIGSTEGEWGKLQVFPVWDSLEEVVDYAKECCVVRELTADEREVFGLPPR
ncbi:MAG: PQQ-binding-like beta-propeller repeat protein, partial [Anaerolineales bacterium]|nr:PQQ-binding-like beta-propeller repeat protein [Anaerolineales bacterium]